MSSGGGLIDCGGLVLLGRAALEGRVSRAVGDERGVPASDQPIVVMTRGGGMSKG